MNKAQPGAPPRSIKSRALQLLSQREHSRAELRRKLLPAALATESGIAPDAAKGDLACRAQQRVEDLLDWLEANRHLSETRFVEARVHARASRFGNLRIRRELALHETPLAPELESELKDNELGRARAVWARKFPAPPTSVAERAKQARFLMGRGFSAEVIHRLLRDVGQCAVDDDGVGADTC